MILSAVFLALGMVLPLFTAQIKEIGDSLLPMHIPVLLCGLMCGWQYGGFIGFILPFLRSVTFSMPPIYPQAVWMALELCAYGLVIGIVYSAFKRKNILSVYASLIIAMLSGRVVWGIAKAVLLGVGGKPFTFAMFLVGGFADALTGIILQLILIPSIVAVVDSNTRRNRIAMVNVKFPYGKEFLDYEFSENELIGILESSIEEYKPSGSADELVRNAMENPICSPKLCELAKGRKNIVIIASDHTRPVPSKVIIPPMIKEIKQGNPEAEVTILIATGCHRGTTRDELVAKFGEDIVNSVNIYVHDCDEQEKLVNLGKLPSGGDCEVNSIAVNADLLVAEGFIEPHFFAGFSGGRKSVLPGVCGRKTVLANHCSEFIADGNARTGILDGNPIHKDMLWAAERAGLKYVVNVVLNAQKEVIYAVAGDTFEAHKRGVEFLCEQCGCAKKEADIVLTTNGGYPLDQNVYQSVKGMTAAEATVKDGGVIIMMAKCNDGVGGDHFYHQMADEPDVQKIMDELMSRGRLETLPDQWMTQILSRILLKASIVYVSEMDDKTVSYMHMIPVHSLDEAMNKAREILGKEQVTVTAIPDGVAVIVR